MIAGLIQVFEILENDPAPREALWRNIRYMVENLRSLGFDVGKTQSGIIPVIVRDEAKLKAMFRDVFDEGVFVNYVGFPAVPRRRPRLRVSMSAMHTRQDLDTALEILARVGRSHGII